MEILNVNGFVDINIVIDSISKCNVKFKTYAVEKSGDFNPE